MAAGNVDYLRAIMGWYSQNNAGAPTGLTHATAAWTTKESKLHWTSEESRIHWTAREQRLNWTSEE